MVRCGYCQNYIVSSANHFSSFSLLTKSAFDSVVCTALWKALRSTPFLICLIGLYDLHLSSKSRVRVNGHLSEPFVTTSGARQGCVLAPALFCIAIDWIISRCAGTMGITLGNTTFTDQGYAYDAVLFTDDPRKWTQILTQSDAACQTMRLHTWIPVNSSHGQVVTRSTRHRVNSSQSTRHNAKLCRRSTRHTGNNYATR